MHYKSFTQSDSHDYADGAGAGFLRIVLLFGSAAVALGLVLIPLFMERGERQLGESLFIQEPDQVMTGSVRSDNGLAVPHEAVVPQR